MKCVPRVNCDFNGVMTEQTLNLTPDLEMLRVQLIVSDFLLTWSQSSDRELHRVVKSYNATNSVVRFWNKKYFPLL
jgi:hypothetical protein